MIKEFEIDDILNAVNSIYKIERKKDKDTKIENYSAGKNEVLNPYNQVKLNGSKILVLDNMIE